MCTPRTLIKNQLNSEFACEHDQCSVAGNGSGSHLSVFVVKAVLLRWLTVMKPTF